MNYQQSLDYIHSLSRHGWVLGLNRVSRLLARDGFTVYCHRQVSANDEGICLGQLAIASAYRRNQHVSGNTYEN